MPRIEHKKNTADYLIFPMVDAATPTVFKTSETVSAAGYYKDGAGSWTTLTGLGSVSEIGNGLYALDLSAANLNHDRVALVFTSAGGASTCYTYILKAKDIDDTPSAADVNAQCDAALADYDGPTKAELDAAEASLAADIAALPDAATVNAQCDLALTDYDAPTKAELDAAETAILAAIAGLSIGAVEASPAIQLIKAAVAGKRRFNRANGNIEIYDALDALVATLEITDVDATTVQVAPTE